MHALCTSTLTLTQAGMLVRRRLQSLLSVLCANVTALHASLAASNRTDCRPQLTCGRALSTDHTAPSSANVLSDYDAVHLDAFSALASLGRVFRSFVNSPCYSGRLPVCLSVRSGGGLFNAVCACHSACGLHFAQQLFSLFRYILQPQKLSFDIIVLTAPLFTVRFFRMSFLCLDSAVNASRGVICSARVTMLQRDIVRSDSFFLCVCLSVDPSHS